MARVGGTLSVVQYSPILRRLPSKGTEILWGVVECMVQCRANLRGRLSVIWRYLVQMSRHAVGRDGKRQRGIRPGWGMGDSGVGGLGLVTGAIGYWL